MYYMKVIKAYDFLIIKQNEQLRPYINNCMIKIKSSFQ